MFLRKHHKPIFDRARASSMNQCVAPAALFAIAILLWTESVHSLSLNPIESFLFKSRIERIQHESRAKFSSEILPSASAEPSSPTKGKRQPRDVVIIFPGAGGPDDLTDELEANLYSSSVTSGNNEGSTLVKTFDWSDNRGSVLTAAFDGEAVGEAVAESLLKSFKGGDGASDETDTCIELRSVHSIGVSVGAFAANEMARTIYQRTRTSLGDQQQQQQKPPYVRLTLLDPFCSRGVWGNGYGASNFGRDADYAVQYLNTDDPVPTTNDPLPLCVCFDVTEAKERNDFILPEGETMHCWPLAYYSRFGINGEKKEGQNTDNMPRFDEDGCPKRGTVVQK